MGQNAYLVLKDVEQGNILIGIYFDYNVARNVARALEVETADNFLIYSLEDYLYNQEIGLDTEYLPVLK